MENEQQNKITLIHRKKMIIEGVKTLIAFDDKEFQMETNLGNLKITGVNLGLDGMDTAKEILSIQGTINSLKYDAEISSKESILKKLFK